MIAAQELTKHISLNKSLSLVGISETRWYYSKSPRTIPTDTVVIDIIQKIGVQTHIWNS